MEVYPNETGREPETSLDIRRILELISFATCHEDHEKIRTDEGNQHA